MSNKTNRRMACLKWNPLLAIPTVLIATTMVFGQDAAENAQDSKAAKPPWQRFLQGDDLKKASELEQSIDKSVRYEEAIAPASELASLRERVQGKGHWQAKDARRKANYVKAWAQFSKDKRLQISQFSKLAQQANEAMRAGKYGEAETRFNQRLAISRKVLGEEHALTAASHNDLAMCLNALGKYSDAVFGLQKALAINRRILGEAHPTTATSYNNLAMNQSSLGKYKQAEAGFEKALTIRRESLGENDLATATSYGNSAANLQALGRYSVATRRFQKDLAICRKLLGDENLDTARAYNNLAMNLNVQARYGEAAQKARKAFEICRKRLGKGHPNTSLCQNNVAVNLQAMGKYFEAAAVFHEVLAAQRNTLGEQHPDTAVAFVNLAANRNALGRYAEAEAGYLQALAIRRKVLGDEHPHTGHSFSLLAANQSAQGKFAEATKGFQKALDIDRKVYGGDHPETAESLSNVATNLQRQRKYVEATERFLKALAIWRKSLGEDHPVTANGYGNIGFNLDARGKHTEAEEPHRKCLAVHRKVHGESHPETAKSYNNLAANLRSQGDLHAAEEMYQKALEIALKCFGDEHPYTAAFYNNLAANYAAKSNDTMALAAFESAVAIREKVRSWSANHGIDRAIATSLYDPESALAEILARDRNTVRAIEVLEKHLGRGLLDELAGHQRSIPASERQRRLELVAKVQSLYQLIASQRSKTDSESAQIVDRMIQDQLEAKAALASLARKWERDYGVAAGKALPLNEIQQKLPKDTALVAWLDANPSGPNEVERDGRHWVFLLRASGDPVVVKLPGTGAGGAWTEDDYLAPENLRQAVRNSKVPIAPKALATMADNRFGPLLPHLGAAGDLPSVRHLVVLPSPHVAGLPVELFAPEGVLVSYAPSGSLYAYLRELPKVTSSGALAIGDPLFTDESTKKEPGEQPLPPRGILVTVVVPNSNAAEHGLRKGDVLLSYDGKPLAESTDLKTRAEGEMVPIAVWREGKELAVKVDPGRLGVALASKPAREALLAVRELDRWTLAIRTGSEKFDPLPGAFLEVAQLSSRFDENEKNRTAWVGSNASEPNLASLAADNGLKRYRYLHFATHGVIDDQRPARSALILSQVGLPDPAAQFNRGQLNFDGRVTVKEIAEQWELDADLVVLSACDTALGRYANGEGYLGFSQALLLAGARSVMLSLWKVEDAATMLLMDRFYGNLLGQHEGIKAPLPKAEALAEAKAWLRDLPLAEAIKLVADLNGDVARGKGRVERPAEDPPLALPQNRLPEGEKPFSHPYYWAAFVLIGASE